MSVLGLVCCDAGIDYSSNSFPPPRGLHEGEATTRSAQSGPDGEFGAGGELAGRDLGTVGRLDAQNFYPSVGADHGEAVGAHFDDLAQLAADALGIAGRQRLNVEDLQRLAVERRPRPGRGIAA